MIESNAIPPETDSEAVFYLADNKRYRRCREASQRGWPRRILSPFFALLHTLAQGRRKVHKQHIISGLHVYAASHRVARRGTKFRYKVAPKVAPDYVMLIGLSIRCGPPTHKWRVHSERLAVVNEQAAYGRCSRGMDVIWRCCKTEPLPRAGPRRCSSGAPPRFAAYQTFGNTGRIWIPLMLSIAHTARGSDLG